MKVIANKSTKTVILVGGRVRLIPGQKKEFDDEIAGAPDVQRFAQLKIIEILDLEQAKAKTSTKTKEDKSAKTVVPAVAEKPKVEPKVEPKEEEKPKSQETKPEEPDTQPEKKRRGRRRNS